MKYSEVPVIKNEEMQQYELTVDGMRSFIDYEMRGDVVLLTHTEVPEELEGKGVAAALVEKTLTEIEKQGQTFLPYCSYIRTFLRRHPGWERMQNKDDSE